MAYAMYCSSARFSASHRLSQSTGVPGPHSLFSSASLSYKAVNWEVRRADTIHTSAVEGRHPIRNPENTCEVPHHIPSCQRADLTTENPICYLWPNHGEIHFGTFLNLMHCCSHLRQPMNYHVLSGLPSRSDVAQTQAIQLLLLHEPPEILFVFVLLISRHSSGLCGEPS